jgi:CRISPR-associated protein Cmr6
MKMPRPQNDKSINEEKFYLANPSDTASILKNFKIIKKIAEYEFNHKEKKYQIKNWYYDSSNIITNPLLIFGKIIPYSHNFIEDNKEEKEHKENKDKYLKEMEKLKQLDLLKKLKERIEITIDKLGLKKEKITVTNSWRMVIGLGGAHPQETSMILHHIYRIPYIPASAVKGVTRHWAVQKFAEILFKNKNEKFDKCLDKVSKSLEKGENLDDLKINIANKEINFHELINIFGTQKKEGKVIFFDAFPSEDIKLKIDIMNPHYPDYYSGKEPPSDWQNPNPIKFLTVEKTKFTFYISIKQSEEKELLEKAKILLEDSLKNYGIGAKTALGYGLFE